MSAAEFDRYAQGGGLVPVYREIPADLLTPVSAYLAISARSDEAFLLESVVGGERVARYSFLGRDPMLSVEVRGGNVVERDGAGVRPIAGDLLSAVRTRLGKQTAEVPGLPRFTGGAVGYLTYDAVRLFERIPDRHPPTSLPVASFSFYRSLVAFDHALQRLMLVSHAEAGRPNAFAEAQGVLDRLEDDLRRFNPVEAMLKGGGPASAAGGLGDGDAFRSIVGKAKDFIGIGDIFQVVLSRQASAACPADPFTVYRALRMVNPSPYMYFFKGPERSIAGASPELLVRVEAGRVQTRPIAGTRRRGASEEEDARLADELLADEKERAEHLMLVDLGRNDLGRVCRFDSVSVPEFMVVERYSHVMHIESLVAGELAPGKDALDALVSTFPAGTLSGAPKIRAMEIIDELEPVRRGLYGGALGYIDLRGNLDFCIAIRTVVFENGQATIQAGAGIVADSDPETEERETEAKSGAMFEALRLAAELGGRP